MTEEKISYNRQEKIFNPINQKYNIIVLGAGSLGSIITLNLAKLGFNNIQVYDFDIVEKHNIPNQIYRINDLGKKKVDALYEIIEDFTDIKIEKNDKKVIKETALPIDLNNIFILTFDTLKSRRLIFDKLSKQEDCYIIDARMGGESFDIQTYNLFDANAEKWKKSFDIKPNDLPCGEKSICYTNFIVAGEVSNIVKKINNEETYPNRIIRNVKNYNYIGGKK